MDSSDNNPLFELFTKFASFGTGSETSMDGSRFGKFFRDMNLLDKKLTPASVDVIFAKTKRKKERKIEFSQFVEAMQLAAEVKYPKDPDAMRKFEGLITIAEGLPSTAGTTATVTVGNVERLTDSSLFTGSHKERFDEEGKGKGLEGRDTVPKGKGSMAVYPNPSALRDRRKSCFPQREKKVYKDTIRHASSTDLIKSTRPLQLSRSRESTDENFIKTLPSYVNGYKGQGTYGKKR